MNFKKILQNRWVIRSLFSSIRINFKYLPIKQAIKLPILVYKAKFRHLQGKLIIDGKISTGMIKLGINRVSIYPNSGIMIENRGTIIFKGKARIGNGAAISTGTEGVLVFGDNFDSTCGLKIACYNSITFEKKQLIGWNCLFSDTNFHALSQLTANNTSPDDKTRAKTGKIYIGTNCWFGSECRCFMSVNIPAFTTVATGTFINRPVNVPPYSVVANRKNVEVIASGVYLNID